MRGLGQHSSDHYPVGSKALDGRKVGLDEREGWVFVKSRSTDFKLMCKSRQEKME